MIGVFIVPSFFFLIYLERCRSIQPHFRLVRIFVFVSMVAQALHAVVLPLENPWANSLTQSLAGAMSGFANVKWVNNMIKAEAVISQSDVPTWLTPYTIGMFIVNALTFPIGEFGTHFAEGCAFLQFQEVTFIFIIALTALPIDVATFFVYKKARKVVVKIEEARSRIQLEQTRTEAVDTTVDLEKTKEAKPSKNKKKSSNPDNKYLAPDNNNNTSRPVANKGNTLTVDGGGGGVKEAWTNDEEPSVSRNAPSRSALSAAVSRTASRFLSLRSSGPSKSGGGTGDMDAGLRIQKAGLRKIRHMMFSFNLVMIIFAALTIWELGTHALERARDPCKFSSLLGHPLYYSIWYLFQLWHTNTARHPH